MDSYRLLAAVMVVWGHSYVFAGRDVPSIAGYGPHTIGVAMFFALSGYLISGSWTTDRSPTRYATKRFLRIWPPLAVVVLVTVFVVGPLVSTFSVAEYFADPRPWQYLVRNLAVLPKHDLPGVFLRNPFPAAVNGSLWTLPVEVACYVAVPFIFIHRAGPWIFAAFAFTAAALVPPGATIAGFGLSGAAGVFPFFAVGVLAFVCGVRVPQGQRLPVDLSYGLYLVSFPVGQVIAMQAAGIGPVMLIAATLGAAIPLAWLLHVAIEGPAERFKRRALSGMLADKLMTPSLWFGVLKVYQTTWTPVGVLRLMRGGYIF